MLHVGQDTFYAAFPEGVGSMGEHFKGFKQAIENHRLKSVQLQLSRLHRHGNGHVVARHQEGRLGDHLGNDGIDLAGHDGGTGLARGQLQFLDAAAGAAGKQAHVVGDFGHHQRAVLDRRGNGGEAVGVLGGVDQVIGGLDGLADQVGQNVHDAAEVAVAGVDAGADGSSA